MLPEKLRQGEVDQDITGKLRQIMEKRVSALLVGIKECLKTDGPRVSASIMCTHPIYGFS